MRPETRHLSFRIPAPLYDELADRAQEEDRSISAVVRRALAADLRSRPDARIGGSGDASQFESASR